MKSYTYELGNEGVNFETLSPCISLLENRVKPKQAEFRLIQ